jgi:hypothetical protein
MIRKDVLKKIKPFHSRYRYVPDIQTWQGILRHSDCLEVPNTRVTYRRHESNTSHTLPKSVKAEEFDRIRRESAAFWCRKWPEKITDEERRVLQQYVRQHVAAFAYHVRHGSVAMACGSVYAIHANSLLDLSQVRRPTVYGALFLALFSVLSAKARIA